MTKQRYCTDFIAIKKIYNKSIKGVIPIIHKKVPLSALGSADYAAFYTYFIDQSPELPSAGRPVVIICPGGGYQMTSDREAEPIALQFNAAGINAVIVRYSVAPARFPTALLEVATAVRYVRETAAEHGCDPNKILVAGFSAGGHLAASYGNFWHRALISEALGCERDILKPNGQILCYPVITSGPYAHQGSMQNLLGERYEAEKDSQSLENFVTENTPPTFIWHTQADPVVPVENALLFVSALQKASIRTEFHLFPDGEHGLALCSAFTAAHNSQIQPHAAKWMELAIEFIHAL